jgi:hypothetical protein
MPPIENQKYMNTWYLLFLIY